MHEDIQREIHVPDIEASGSDVDTEGWMVKDFLKRRDFVRPNLSPHDGQISYTRIQRAHRGRRAVHPVFKLHARMIFAEACFPGLHEFAHEVSSRTAMSPKTKSTGDSLLRLICRQSISALRAAGDHRAQDGHRDEREP